MRILADALNLQVAEGGSRLDVLVEPTHPGEAGETTSAEFTVRFL